MSWPSDDRSRQRPADGVGERADGETEARRASLDGGELGGRVPLGEQFVEPRVVAAGAERLADGPRAVDERELPERRRPSTVVVPSPSLTRR